jgi:hypothetical protein
MTDSSDCLIGIRLKRTRAWELLEGLKRDIQAFLEQRPYRPRVKFDPSTARLTVSVEVTALPDPMWGVRIGEIVHNLRSALDHVVWQLAGCPTHRSSKTQFPIFETAAGFADRGRKQFLKGVDERAVRIIESEQPFFVRGDGTCEGVDRSPLWHLKQISDVDKHRTLHLTGGLLAAYHCHFPTVKLPFTLADVHEYPGGPIQEDTELWSGLLVGAAEWPFEGGGVQTQLQVEVTFEPGVPAAGNWAVYGTLADIGNRTDQILRRIANDGFGLEL